MTTVTSNGIAYPKHAHELKGLIDILQFSLHGPDMETHDAVSVTPSFDSVMESVDIAFSQGDTPTFIHTVTDENISRVNDVIDLARKKKALIFLNPEFSYFGNSGLSHKEAKSLIDMAKGPGVTVDRGFIEFYLAGGNRRYNPSCLAVTSTIVISPDDKLILPCYHRMTREEPIEGNLEELRRSPIVQFEEHQQGKYRFCEGCAVNCYMRASLYRKPGPFRWPSIQSALNYGWELSKAKLGTIIKGIVR
jgi:MoaA/NifB/PqqE/SkfB family radical SAM enzyme